MKQAHIESNKNTYVKNHTCFIQSTNNKNGWIKANRYIVLLVLVFATGSISAQDSNNSERYGNTLNMGLGLGYYGYDGHTMPAAHLDVEFDVVRNFTLAPFINLYSYRRTSPHQSYYYHETVIPIGVKATYYFDSLFRAGSNWDFYLAGSLGYAITFSYWDEGYEGDINLYSSTRPLFIDIHIGTEYHFSSTIGAFIDLSSGMSTIGLAIHL